MRCQNCDADIPPQWVAAIQANKCPGCNGDIMNATSKELLDELTLAMERMPNNPQGIAGWLISNFQFRKIGDAQPVDHFHTKKAGMTEDLDTSNLKIANNPAQQYLKRTDAFKNIEATRAKLAQSGQGQDNTRQQALLNIAQQFENLDDNMYGDGSNNIALPELEEDYVEDRGPKLSRNLLTDTPLIDASIPPLTPEQIKALTKGPVTHEDPEAAHRILQAQRLKRLEAQQAVESGVGVNMKLGGFRRG